MKNYKSFISYVLVLVAIVMSSCNNNVNRVNKNSGNGNDSIETSEDSLAIETDSIDAEQYYSDVQWKYSYEKDEMDDSMNYWCTLSSDNAAYFDFPYNEDFGSHLSINVRYMKKYGYDVYLSITKGQMGGSEYNGTNYVRVRFDNEKPKKWYFSESSDGSSDMVFLNNPKSFIKKCQKAKSIIIEQEFYNNGVHTFKFKVDEPLKSNIRSY